MSSHILSNSRISSSHYPKLNPPVLDRLPPTTTPWRTTTGQDPNRNLSPPSQRFKVENRTSLYPTLQDEIDQLDYEEETLYINMHETRNFGFSWLVPLGRQNTQEEDQESNYTTSPPAEGGEEEEEEDEVEQGQRPADEALQLLMAREGVPRPVDQPAPVGIGGEAPPRRPEEDEPEVDLDAEIEDADALGEDSDEEEEEEEEESEEEDDQDEEADGSIEMSEASFEN